MREPNEEQLLGLRQESEERIKLQRDADLKAVLSTSSGRRLVWRLIDAEAGAFSLSFTGAMETTAFAEGKRSVGLALVIECQRVSSADYVQMLMEHLQSQKNEATRRDVELIESQRDE